MKGANKNLNSAKMKGGVIIASQFRKQYPTQPDQIQSLALRQFLTHVSSVKILTDSSISGVTFLCTLRPDYETPYYAVRSTNLYKPVKQILLKIILHTDDEEVVYITNIARRDNSPHAQTVKEATPAKTVIEEAKLQQQIYCASFKDTLSPCEPICPAIIGYETGLNDSDKYSLEMTLTQLAFQERPFDKTKHKNRDREIVDWLFKSMHDSTDVGPAKTSVSYIVMEMLEGYQTLADVPDADYSHARITAAYEFARLACQFGVAHNDAHQGNVMINGSDDTYFNGKWKGRAIIIDFGRSTPYNKPNPNPFENALTLHTCLSAGNKSDYGDRSAWTLILGGKNIDDMKAYINLMQNLMKIRQEAATAFLQSFAIKYPGRSFNTLVNEVYEQNRIKVFKVPQLPKKAAFIVPPSSLGKESIGKNPLAPWKAPAMVAPWKAPLMGGDDAPFDYDEMFRNAPDDISFVMDILSEELQEEPPLLHLELVGQARGKRPASSAPLSEYSFMQAGPGPIKRFKPTEMMTPTSASMVFGGAPRTKKGSKNKGSKNKMGSTSRTAKIGHRRHGKAKATKRIRRRRHSQHGF